MSIRNGKIFNCETCRKEIYINPSRLKNKHHTCSRVCLGIFSSKLQSQKIKTECKFCKKEIFYKQSHFKKIRNHTCSLQCNFSLMKLTRSGKQNSNFKNRTNEEKFFHKKCLNLKLRSEHKNWEFNLDPNYLLNLYNKQKGLCGYTNFKMVLETRRKSKTSYDVLSVDRIDSSKGYIKGNILFCLNCINKMKSDYDLMDLIKVFGAISMTYKPIVFKIVEA